MNVDQFKHLANTYSAIPVYRELMADTETPVSLFLKMRKDASYPFLLESVEGGENLARYSFLGRNPYQLLRFEDHQVTLNRDDTITQFEENYFDVLERLTTAYQEPEIPDLPLLRGGAVGFSSYDTIRQYEHLPNTPEDDLQLPDAIWAFYDEIFAFDHVKQRIIIIKTVFVEDDSTGFEQLYEQAQAALDTMQEIIHRPLEADLPFQINPDDISSNTERADFEQSVKTIKEYIHEGDIFQAVLSQRFQTEYSGDRFMLYRALRMVNPSPYLFYLDFEDFALVGSSPEVLVRVQNDEVQLLPIAGTRPRGQTREEDEALEKDLLNDPKEISEHIMLVDLGRNDLSRVCKPTTVQLERDMIIERYSHVMHIVSDVMGTLQKNETSVSALKNCFPAGTVSGAPKIRAMEIIDELEPTKRGPYAGAVGYFDFSGNMDTCIAIRTMVATKDNVYVQAGAGIVADSDPAREFEETENKASALIEAMSLALSLTSTEPKSETETE